MSLVSSGLAGPVVTATTICACVAWAATLQTTQRAALPDGQTPEARAVAYLAREVPAWRREHACYSCHNNGDAPRALIAARALGHNGDDALADTLDWLKHPARWEDNAGGEGGADDKPLARIQFAATLAAAVEHGLADRGALAAAADLLAADQQPDGSWRLDSSQSLGSPATYGTTLATASARSVLVRAQQPQLRERIARADAWLRELDVKSVLDAASVMLGLERADDDAANLQRQRCLELIKIGQAPNGGWGPYVTAAPEPFDTAVAMLALGGLTAGRGLAQPVFTDGQLHAAIDRGRAFRVARQERDGNWPETTRPAGQESYAQRISTTAWATMALLSSAGK